MRKLALAAVLLCAATEAEAQVVSDCSGTIASGGVAQTIIPSSASTHGFMIMNLSTNLMWISVSGTAAANSNGSFSLNPASATSAGGSFSTPPNLGNLTPLSVVSANNGDRYSCARW